MRTAIYYCLTLSSLVALAATEVLAAPITVPAGLNPGDQYRLVFLTTAKRTGSSSDIADYNTFVDNVAEAIPELALLGQDWKAIASTSSIGGPTVDARTNTSTDPSVMTGVPIFLLNGAKLVDDYADLWDGSVDVRLNINESGNFIANTTVWTGTGVDGFASGVDGSRALGYGSAAEQGYTAYLGPDWITGGLLTTSLSRSLYGISGVMTVIPEPSTALMLGLGLLALAARRK